MTSEDREDIKRHLGVVVEGLRSEIQQVAEGVTANTEALERFRSETVREFAVVRAEMSAGFTAVRSDAKAFRAETAREFAAVRVEMSAGSAAVRSEAKAFRAETARNFAVVQSQIDVSHSDIDRT